MAVGDEGNTYFILLGDLQQINKGRIKSGNKGVNSSNRRRRSLSSHRRLQLASLSTVVIEVLTQRLGVLFFSTVGRTSPVFEDFNKNTKGIEKSSNGILLKYWRSSICTSAIAQPHVHVSIVG